MEGGRGRGICWGLGRGILLGEIDISLVLISFRFLTQISVSSF